MTPLPGENGQALVAIAVHLAKLDTRSEARSEQLDKIEAGVDQINGRLREVEQEQSALRDRMKWISGIVTGAVAGIVGLFVKSST